MSLHFLSIPLSFPCHFLSMSASFAMCAPRTASHSPTLSPCVSVDCLVTVCHVPAFPLHSPCVSHSFPLQLPSSSSSLTSLDFLSFPLPVHLHVIAFSWISPSCALFAPFPCIPPSLPVISMHFQRFARMMSKSAEFFNAFSKGKPETRAGREAAGGFEPGTPCFSRPEDCFYQTVIKLPRGTGGVCQTFSGGGGGVRGGASSILY